MRICGISDLHGHLPKVENMPPCDVVCIAGDISPLDIQRDNLLSAIWFGNTFIPWCESLPCIKVILVGGNHDFFLEDYDKPGGVTLKLGKEHKLIYLRNSTYKFGHKTFYGTPHVTNLSKWAFNLNNDDAYKVFGRIPNCDVLITHTPPFNAASTGNVFGSIDYPDYGSYILSECIEGKKINLIICGHVHSGNHEVSEWRRHIIANVSYLNEDYKPTYSPLTIEL